MTYVYKCPSCGRQYEKDVPDYRGVCENTHRIVGEQVDDVTLRRDYRAEGAGVDLSSLRIERMRQT